VCVSVCVPHEPYAYITYIVHTAPRCNKLQHTATNCNTLQHTAHLPLATDASQVIYICRYISRCNTLQHIKLTVKAPWVICMSHAAIFCNTQCNTLQQNARMCTSRHQFVRTSCRWRKPGRGKQNGKCGAKPRALATETGRHSQKSALWSCVVVGCCVMVCVVVHCCVLQCVAVCCSVLQCVAMCCSVLQCVAMWGSRKWMRMNESRCSVCMCEDKCVRTNPAHARNHYLIDGNKRQHAATHGNDFEGGQHTSTLSSTRQHNTTQHTTAHLTIPPIDATIFLVMARPRPVPPWRRA